jgi:hypothetical protein
VFSVSGLDTGVGGLTDLDLIRGKGRGRDCVAGVGAHGREGVAVADDFIEAGAHGPSFGMAALAPNESKSLQFVED